MRGADGIYVGTKLSPCFYYDRKSKSPRNADCFLGVFNHLHMKRSAEQGTSLGTVDGLATAIFCLRPQVFPVLLPRALYLAPRLVPPVFLWWHSCGSVTLLNPTT